MRTPFEVKKSALRRFLLEKSNLWPSAQVPAPGTDDVIGMIRRLECVQIDPVAAVERNQHLVLHARIPTYMPSALEHLLSEGRVFEYMANAACVIPMEDYPLFENVRRRIQLRLQDQLSQMEPVVQHVLQRLEAEGPLPAKAFEAKERVRGYWDNEHAKTKATSHALNLLNDVGQIQVVRREGTTRFFDIRDRAVPKHLLSQANDMEGAEVNEALLEKYLRAYRVVDWGDFRFGWQRLTAAERQEAVQKRVKQGTLIPLHVEDVRRPYFILAEDHDLLRDHAKVESQANFSETEFIRFMPPLDNLLWRRERVLDLFGFSYTWEVYMPPAKRRFGYYALPILAGDTLIGRIDPRLDRENRRLHIRLLQIEPGIRWSARLRKHLMRALEKFAQFHGAHDVIVENTEPDGLSIP
jgi:uncharacterized protein